MPRRKTTTFGTSDSPTKQPLDGLFTNGQWYCNCQPRLPAIQFQVKKKTKNKGRWFYTCQVDKTKGKTGEPQNCGFFLWAENARLREEGAVLGNSTTEPGGTQAGSLRTPKKLVQTTLSASVTPREEGPRHWTHRTGVTPIAELEKQIGGATSAGTGDTAQSSRTLQQGTAASGSKTTASSRTLDHDFNESDLDTDDEGVNMIAESASKAASPPGKTPTAQDQTPSAAMGSKRKRPIFGEDNDDLFGETDSDEERQLAAMTDSSSQSRERTRDAFATPAARRPTDIAAGMPTPSLTDKPVRRVLFADSETPANIGTHKRQRVDDSGGYANVGVPSTPSSSQDAAMPSSSPNTPGTPGASLGNITGEIMELLKGQAVDEKVLRQVKTALEKYAAKAKGIELGRDASRKAVKNADARIAQLQMRVADLENKRKLDADARRKMKAGLMELYTGN
ncbi:hypothetical protein JX266_009576 [Neoarthrinium moseri]|nr:hypothetical protein JX266_009576 [Neoarthrinium moseri]